MKLKFILIIAIIMLLVVAPLISTSKISVVQNPSDSSNYIALGADVGFAFTPYVPNVKRGAEVVKLLDKVEGGRDIKFVDPRELQATHLLNRVKSPGQVDSLTNIQDLKISISKKGFDVNNPIEVLTLPDGTKSIVQGHHRTRAAIDLGLEKVPTIEANPNRLNTFVDGTRATPGQVAQAAREVFSEFGKIPKFVREVFR